MTLEEFKAHLSKVSVADFILPKGEKVPDHYHLTEVGLVTKDFIDCGGKRRTETSVSLQLWSAEDYEHRLTSTKILKILDMATAQLELSEQLVVEVEYQGESIERYGLGWTGERFELRALHTDCLAKEECGITIMEIAGTENQACTPGGGCC